MRLGLRFQYLTLSFLVGAAIFSFGQPLSGTYTVGVTGNYVTLASAVNDVVTRGVSAPVTFKIKTGTYTEQVTINA
ncbi:MAG: hypothetical protein JNL53_15205, partial [Cyclobacteriaceae bacterium]|nr:hypothetical protein [Cyclobacteriaceae bacterium]